VHYVSHGSGLPTLVFVHGFTCDHTDWRRQLSDLGSDFQVVAVDLRGHGATPGRPQECSIPHYGGDVAALIANLELSKVVLVGHSMGTRVVLEAARLDTERVKGLVLIDGSRQATRDPQTAEQAALGVIAGAGGYRAWVEPLVAQMFVEASAASRGAIARALKLDPELGTQLWSGMVRWDAEHMDATLAAVRAPVLAIQSTRINAERKRVSLQPGECPPYLELLKERIKDLRVEIVPGIGHFTQSEAPETVNRLLREFASRAR
jgi:pimeloyl-ACP methyl ester carboxylesterase